MFVKDNILYADAYHYLKRKNVRVVAMAMPLYETSPDDYEELPLPDPIDVSIGRKNVYWGNRLFTVRVSSMRYADIKKAVIKSRYSDDDQMALILNRDKNPEKELLYRKMQQWREFAADIASAACAASVSVNA